MKKNIDWYSTLLKWFFILMLLFVMGWNFSWIYRALKEGDNIILFSYACVANVVLGSIIKRWNLEPEYEEDEPDEEMIIEIKEKKD